jgi:exosortase/archaeosortase family protein
MKRFAALYFLYLAVLFTFFYAHTSDFSLWLNGKQTELTLFLLHFFLKPEQLQGIDIWITPHYKIYISQACNGFIPIFFLWAAILAYPVKWWHKIVWMSIGYAVFAVVNIVRLLIVVHFAEVAQGGANFYWSHDLLGNAILMVTGLGLFIAFIKTSSNTPSPLQ